MTDLEAAEREWHDWIRAACDAVGVDPALVDVSGVHELTRDIAHGFSRPMAPVGAFIWGIALGRTAATGPHGAGDEMRAAESRGVDAARLRRAIAETVEGAATSGG